MCVSFLGGYTITLYAHAGNAYLANYFVTGNFAFFVQTKMERRGDTEAEARELNPEQNPWNQPES